MRWRLTGITLATTALLTVAAGNVALFAATFPQLTPPLPDGVAVRLPPHAEVSYRPPPPPPFLAQVTAPSVYVVAEPPARLPLLRRAPDDLRPLASLTKLASALVVLDAAPHWDEVVVVSAADYRGGARPRLAVGEAVRLRDLWEVALVGSDNDALAALVRGLGFTESSFVQAMNEKARALGLTQTRFVEPTGLAPGNVSTAREVAVLARTAFARPEVAQTLAAVRTVVTVDGAPRVILSSDQHLKTFADVAASGWRFVTGKTGYLPEGGYNAAVLGQGKDGVPVLAIVLGSASLDDRTREVADLVRWGTSVAAERLAATVQAAQP